MPRATLRRLAVLALALGLASTGRAEPAAALADVPIPRATHLGPDLSKGRAALRAARDAVGAGYAMGAAGPGAFDCSGLTMHALRRAGVSLPRTSFAQYEAGERVARDDLRAGDLVFFSTNGPGPSHVGVATGRGTVISATSSGGVMEHPIDDDYWGPAYVGARRVT